MLRGGRAVLRDFSLRIEAGEHIAILGPNGSGKSTFLKLISRECYPVVTADSYARVMGRERWNVFDLRTHLGIVSNDLAAACALEVSALDLVLSGFFSSLGVAPHHEIDETMRTAARNALDRVRASAFAARLMVELSSGEARRVLIARALVHAPTALVLDEPSTSLDYVAQRELRDIVSSLAREGVAIVLVTHHLEEIVPEIERVVLLRDGAIVADGPKTDVLTATMLHRAFGASLEIVERSGVYFGR